jgi:di/tricarboxylate transporter
MILAAMVAAVSIAGIPMIVAALVAAGIMLAARCTTGTTARRSIDWQVLTVIAAALALGRGLELSGASTGIADAGLALAGNNERYLLYR